MTSRAFFEHDPLWHKDAVIYQLHVKTFFDSNGDGIGDFKGLTQKLDYLKNLGITVIWLLPFYPSPLKDDGYDIANYYDVHPQYGTLHDFKDFLRQAHERQLRVITELVINHTSDQHPWFARARKAKAGSNHRNFYVWSGTSEKYRDARIIFKDFEQSNWAWDEEAQAYYWHRFYAHQPDLNFDNPSVQREIFRVADFWFGLGVDGLRLDAIPYLFEREGTNCENLPETYDFLRKFRRHIDGKFKNRMLLAEANQWPEDAVQYFGQADMCHMAFHFPLMPRIYMSVQMEDRFPITDILEQTPGIPDSCQWAIFLRNHDELTLEMVTDEERDYMYRTYARDPRSKINLGIRRRLVPLLGNNRRKIELMNILLFSLLGTPIVYYGDEIGMGDNHFLGDRDGVRTPMQWSPDRNAGFSRANPQQLYLPVIIDSEYHYETVNVETQEGNLSSLLWWMKRVIAMRKNFKAFSRGGIKLLFPDNAKVLAFIREYEEERILVVINLSRFSQAVELDLKEYGGCVPREVFSQNMFPAIKDTPYMMTLGPHNHFWFELKKDAGAAPAWIEKSSPIKTDKSWEEILLPKNVAWLENSVLPQYLKTCRWFGGKARTIRDVKICDSIPLFSEGDGPRLLILSVRYTSGISEYYSLPLAFTLRETDKGAAQEFPSRIMCRLTVNGREGCLLDGVYDQRVQARFLEIIAQRRKIRNHQSMISGIPGKEFKNLFGNRGASMPSHVLKAEQSNTAIIYDNTFFLKIFRKLEEGLNPEVEISQMLTERKSFPHVPAFAGILQYRRENAPEMTLSVLQAYVPSQSDAWTYSLDEIKTFYELVLVQAKEMKKGEGIETPSDTVSLRRDEDLRRLINGFYLEMVKLLGKRTGEMHLSLAAADVYPDFRPEPFSMLYQRSVYQAMGSQARRVLRLLHQRIEKLPVDIQGEAAPILEKEREIYACFKWILENKYPAKKIRIHGDYHLGQVLFTGKDFVIIDFEGEPACSLTERRLKRSALRDLAGMIRSFHYAVYATLFLNKSMRKEDVLTLETAADLWYEEVTKVFINSYWETIGDAEFLPKGGRDLDRLLRIYLLDKSIYELGYELNNRPDWLVIPLRGIRHSLDYFSSIIQEKKKKS